MATKKKTTKKFVEVTGGYGNRYQLEDNRMVSIRSNGRVWKFGRFIPRGEVVNVLRGLFREGNVTETMRSYYSNSGMRDDRIAEKGRDGSLIVGCHTFTPTSVRKLARWAGVTIVR